MHPTWEFVSQSGSSKLDQCSRILNTMLAIDRYYCKQATLKCQTTIVQYAIDAGKYEVESLWSRVVTKQEVPYGSIL